MHYDNKSGRAHFSNYGGLRFRRPSTRLRQESVALSDEGTNRDKELAHARVHTCFSKYMAVEHVR